MNQDIIDVDNMNKSCTIEPSPKWVQDFTKEIRIEFKLDHLTAMCIAGVMEKYLRKNNINFNK